MFKGENSTVGNCKAMKSRFDCRKKRLDVSFKAQCAFLDSQSMNHATYPQDHVCPYRCWMCSLNEPSHYDWSSDIGKTVTFFLSALYSTPFWKFIHFLATMFSLSWAHGLSQDMWNPLRYFPIGAGEKGLFPSWVMRCRPDWSGAMSLLCRKQP